MSKPVPPVFLRTLSPVRGDPVRKKTVSHLALSAQGFSFASGLGQAAQCQLGLGEKIRTIVIQPNVIFTVYQNSKYFTEYNI
ncbi:MAG: hypothetical protein Q4F57_05380 [Weeksellaceae bacterium]|nr:hypothetical protein [Weeksellaceae bacterium]